MSASAARARSARTASSRHSLPGAPPGGPRLRGSRRPRRSGAGLRALAAALVALAALLGLAGEAAAQDTALLTNMGLSITSQTERIEDYDAVSQPFTSGSYSGGYKLHRIMMEGRADAPRSAVSVTLHEDSDGNPGTQLATFTNPSSWSDSQILRNMTFTLSTPVVLDADTKYHIRMTADSDREFEIRRLGTTSADGNSSAGWTFNGLRRDSTNGGWSSTGSALRMALFGEFRPGVPRNLRAEVTALGEVQVSWDAPEGGPSVAGYTYRHRRGEGAFSSWSNTYVPRTSRTWTGLDGGSDFTFEIRSIVDDVNDFGPAASLTFYVFKLVPYDLEEFTASGDDRAIVLTWHHRMPRWRPVDSYEVRWKRRGLTWEGASLAGENRSWLTLGVEQHSTGFIINLPANLPEWTYDVEARARNVLGNSATKSAQATPGPRTAPGAPSSVAAEVSGPGAVQVTWEAPSGSPSGVRYEVQSRRSDASWPQGWTHEAGLARLFTGLDNGVAHDFRVRAVVGRDRAGPAAEAGATPIDVPNALGTRNVTSVDGALVLAWTHSTTAARPVVEYEARWKRAANDWSGSSASDEQRSWTRFGGPQTRSRRIGGLTNGTAYDVAVRGVNGAGTGEAWEFERTPSVPGAPSGVPSDPRNVRLVAGEERLVLSWLPPSTRGATARYRYGYGPAGGSIGPVRDLGTDARQVTITGLERGTRYRVWLAATNSVGTSQGRFHYATVFGRPYAVRDLAADPDDGQVVLTWREPRGSGSPVTGYRWRTKFATVAWGEDGTSEWFDLPVTARTVTSVTFSALNGTTFDYQVRAVNAIGEGDLGEVSATPLNERPDAPPDFAAREGHRAVGLTWNAPPDAGPAVTGYEVEVRRAGASGFAALATVTGTAYLDAAPGGTGVAHYRVRAVNAAGDGAWAVLEDVALGPAAVGIEAAGARVEEGVSAAFTLTATRPPLAGGPALEVAVAVSETGGDRVAAGDEGTRTVAVPAGAAREAFAVASADDTAVEPDSVVRARVAASTDYATGSPAEAEVTVTEDDAVPGSVGVVLFEGHRAARVAWAPPEHAGASEITGYDVGYRLVGTTAWRTVAAGAAATELTLAHLDDGRWQFRVRAVNAEGAGPWSPGHGAAVVGPATVTVTAGDDVAAGAPARFTLSADRAPMDPSRPLAVEVALAESGGDLVAAAEEGSRTVAFALGETSAPLAVATGGEGTAGGASTLTATLADGAGAYLSGTPASAELAVTPGAARLPDAPTGVAAEPGHRAALVRWEAPARESAAPVTGYEVSWSRNGVEAGLASTAATAYLIETVHAHGEHAVRVRAVSAAGAGAWSEPLAVDVVSATVTVEADADAVVEGTPAAFTLAADRPALSSERTLEVTVSVSETGERVAPDDEGTRTVAFAVGARSAALAVATERDADAEDDSTLTVTLPAASGYSVGDPASAAVAVTGAGAPGVPRALAVAPGHRALGLSWEAPLAGGAPVTGYTVRFRASEDAPWATLSLGKDDTSVVLELADGDWALEVAAVGAGGAGRWVATKATVARAEVRIGALEQGVAEGSAARFALSADRPVLVATRGLSVPVTVSETGAMVAPGDEGTRTVAFAVGASEAAFEVATADDGAAAADSTVTAALAASAGYRAGTPAEAEVVVYASGKPPAPPDLVATEGHSTAKLAWGEPDGGAVVRYEVQVSSADLPAWSTLAGADAAAGLTARSFVAGVGLTHGEGYRFRVRAVNAVGAGPWSEVEGVAVVPATVRVVPGVNVAEGASAVFTLLADRPVLDAAGRPLEVGISVTETGADMVAEADEGTRTVVFAAGARAAAVRIASAEDFGAGPDSVVRVEVAAPASVGDYRVGAPAAGAVTVLDGGDAPPLGAPANLAATEGHLAVALAWEAPPAGGGALSHYEVQYLEGGTWRALDALPAGTALTAGALPEGTYRFRVRAANAGGAGPWSATLAGVEIARATVGIDAAAGGGGRRRRGRRGGIHAEHGPRAARWRAGARGRGRGLRDRRRHGGGGRRGDEDGGLRRGRDDGGALGRDRRRRGGRGRRRRHRGHRDRRRLPRRHPRLGDGDGRRRRRHAVGAHRASRHRGGPLRGGVGVGCARPRHRRALPLRVV